MYVLQNMIVASAGIFNLEKSDKNVFLQHHLHPFLFNFAHGFCLVLVLIVTGEEYIKYSVSLSVLPLPLKI